MSLIFTPFMRCLSNMIFGFFYLIITEAYENKNMAATVSLSWKIEIDYRNIVAEDFEIWHYLSHGKP
ncbi:MAG: hypothetical protein HDR01_00100 [Lachnospiraceae bacterium]|nr:hypothetical protein [Lachnospiraceae bacterium]